MKITGAVFNLFSNFLFFVPPSVLSGRGSWYGSAEWPKASKFELLEKGFRLHCQKLKNGRLEKGRDTKIAKLEKAKNNSKMAPEIIKLKDSGQIIMWKRFLEVFSARMHLEILNLDEFGPISSHFYFFHEKLGFNNSYPPFGLPPLLAITEYT